MKIITEIHALIMEMDGTESVVTISGRMPVGTERESLELLNDLRCLFEEHIAPFGCRVIEKGAEFEKELPPSQG